MCTCFIGSYNKGQNKWMVIKVPVESEKVKCFNAWVRSLINHALNELGANEEITIYLLHWQHVIQMWEREREREREREKLNK